MLQDGARQAHGTNRGRAPFLLAIIAAIFWSPLYQAPNLRSHCHPTPELIHGQRQRKCATQIWETIIHLGQVQIVSLFEIENEWLGSCGYD